MTDDAGKRQGCRLDTHLLQDSHVLLPAVWSNRSRNSVFAHFLYRSEACLNKKLLCGVRSNWTTGCRTSGGIINHVRTSTWNLVKTMPLMLVFKQQMYREWKSGRSQVRPLPSQSMMQERRERRLQLTCTKCPQQSARVVHNGFVDDQQYRRSRRGNDDKMGPAP